MSRQKKIIENIKHSLTEKKEYRVFHTPVWIKDSMPGNVNLERSLEFLEKRIPEIFFDNIDIIYIGDFELFHARQTNAAYLDGAIYISNIQDDEKDLLDDIIHELAHSLEEKYGDIIYSDGIVQNEFLLKRKMMKRILDHKKYKTSDYDFFNIDYDLEFDKFLYQDIGYMALNQLTSNIFNSAYAATSLREYFANGFEEYYLGSAKRISSISPKLYHKLTIINQMGE